MSRERSVRIAMELMKIGVSQAGIRELLVGYPYEQIERQLRFLPLRKAKRPEAFIIEAIRHNYSPPKEFFYAKNETQSTDSQRSLDQGSQLPVRRADADIEGH